MQVAFLAVNLVKRTYSSTTQLNQQGDGELPTCLKLTTLYVTLKELTQSAACLLHTLILGGRIGASFWTLMVCNNSFTSSNNGAQ